MNNFTGKICPFCKSPFEETDDIVICSACDMPHHKDCWITNAGCTTFGCLGSIQAADGSASSVTAKQLEYDDTPFCTNCGRKGEPGANFCSTCGTRLFDTAEAKESLPIAPSPPLPPASFAGDIRQQPYVPNGRAVSSTSHGPSPSALFKRDLMRLVKQNTSYYSSHFDELKAQNKANSWNWAAFLVTPYWLIYRKMYGHGAAFLAVAFVIFLCGIPLLSLVTLGGNIFFGLRANYLYITFLKQKLRQANHLKEPQRSQFIEKTSGVNVTATTLTIVGYALLVLILSL